MRAQIGFEQDDSVVKIGLVEVTEGGIFQDRRSGDEIDLCGSLEVVVESLKPCSDISEISPDPDRRAVFFVRGAGRGVRVVAIIKEFEPILLHYKISAP